MDNQNSRSSLDQEVRRLSFLLGLTERLQSADGLQEICQFALTYLVETMGAAFGDVKVISGDGPHRIAGMLTNQVSSEFIATYGEAVQEMEALLKQSIPYGKGVLWEVVDSRKPLFIDDYAAHPRAVDGLRHSGIGQLAIFPITDRQSKIIAVLTLESRTELKLQEAPQQDMLLAACRTLGVAIERAQIEEELRNANVELAKASRLKSEFLASMSHELRTPLNSIIGFSDLIRRQNQEALAPRHREYLDIIEKSGQHLLQLINDILDLSKIEAGKLELEIQPIAIASLCQDCLRMIQSRADKKLLRLSLELDPHIHEVWLDERRTRQILINLLSNAVKFTSERGLVKLSCRLAYGSELQQENRIDSSPVNASTPYLCLEVQDTGIGIPREKQALLFRPFQQVDAALNRQHEGTGLGLVLTKYLAELHCGTVSFFSEENRGSCFRVWLPMMEKKQMKSSEVMVTSSADNAQFFSGTEAQKITILLVEDQPLNQTLIREFLEGEKYQVMLIEDGEVLQNYLQNNHYPHPLPDLILMDVQLPKVDGLSLLRQLKQHPQWQRIPAIAVTAMAMLGDRDRCLAAGAVAYLSKPLDLDTLLAAVQQYLPAEQSEAGKGEVPPGQ